jgi:hypothetical protein
MVQQAPPRSSSSRMDSGQNPMKEPWAALTNDSALEPTGELCLKKVKDKWALACIVALSNGMLMDVIDD